MKEIINRLDNFDKNIYIFLSIVSIALYIKVDNFQYLIGGIILLLTYFSISNKSRFINILLAKIF